MAGEVGRDVAALRAGAHPLRLRILSLLTGASMSAAELARELGTSQANASYHLRVLADAGEVVPDGEVSVRGGVAKLYRHPWDRGGENRRVADRRIVLCDAELWVGDDVWAEVVEHVLAASTLMHRHAQAPHTAGTTRRNLRLAAFEMRADP